MLLQKILFLSCCFLTFGVNATLDSKEEPERQMYSRTLAPNQVATFDQKTRHMIKYAFRFSHLKCTPYLTECTYLEELYLGSTEFAILRQLNLPNLIKLEIPNGQISDLEENFFAHLPKLIYLNLYRNQLGQIPQQICALDNLTVLEIGRNNIREWPKQIEGLKGLKVLSLTQNSFTRIPTAGLMALQSLRRADLTHNHIRSISAEDAPLLDVRFTVSLLGNPISFIDPVINNQPFRWLTVNAMEAFEQNKKNPGGPHYW